MEKKMGTGIRDRLSPAVDYRLEINGVTVATFRECSGLDLKSTADLRLLTDILRESHSGPGTRASTNIVLKHGIATGGELLEWRSRSSTGVEDRRSVSIVLQNRVGEEVKRWNVKKASITKYESADFNATGNDVSIDSIELDHDGLTLA
jgi:phage tail-like protein